MDLSGSPEGLINPRNLRAKGAPGKDQCHLSYTFHYYVSSKELTKVTCTQVAATFAKAATAQNCSVAIIALRSSCFFPFWPRRCSLGNGTFRHFINPFSANGGSTCLSFRGGWEDLCDGIKQLSAHTFQLPVLTRWICHISLSVSSA